MLRYVDGSLIRFIINEQDWTRSQDRLAGALEERGQPSQAVRVLLYNRNYPGSIVTQHVRSVEGAVGEVLVRFCKPSPSCPLVGFGADKDLVQPRLCLTPQTVSYPGQYDKHAISGVGGLGDHRHEARRFPALYVAEDQAAGPDLFGAGTG